jgi:hypothetical protein
LLKIQRQGPIAELLGKSAVNYWVFVAKLSDSSHTLQFDGTAVRRRSNHTPANKVIAIPNQKAHGQRVSVLARKQRCFRGASDRMFAKMLIMTLPRTAPATRFVMGGRQQRHP